MKRPTSSVRRVILAALLALVVGCLVGGVAVALATPTTTTRPSTTTGGEACATPPSDSRLAPIFYRPPNLDRATPVPLVIGLHAKGSSPASFEASSGLDQVANEHGFVVAYLGSSDPSAAWNPHTNDLAYISSVIDELTAPGNPCGPIDPQRVYVTGFSLGGFETFRTGCELSAKVAAIAPVGQAMLASRPCNVSRPVSELTIVGSNDAVPYSPTAGIPVDTSDTTARWRRIDGCSSHSQTSQTGPVMQTTWDQCNDGSTVGLYVVQGGGHEWPGDPQATGPDAQFRAAEAIWSFFAKLPRTSTTAASAKVLSVHVSGGRERQVRTVVGLSESTVQDPGNAYYQPIVLRAELRTSGGRVVTSKKFKLSRGTRTSPIPFCAA